MPAIRARFRRGDSWLSARLRLLTEQTVSIATSCPPPSGSLVEVELAGPGGELTAEALVIATTPVEMAELLGAPGFGARFVRLSPDARELLSRLVSMVRYADGTVTRPPARTAPRFPIRWPLRLRLGDSRERAIAYDISQRGLFIGRRDPLPPADELVVSIPTDVDDGPIAVRAQTARRLTEPFASSRRLRAGYGLELLSWSPGDRSRYLDLVDRVAARSRVNVLVGAPPRAGHAIARALSAVGYAAAVARDGEALLADCHAYDLVVLEETIYRRHARTWRLRLDATGVPWFHATADEGRAIRDWADAICLRRH
jgi:hypothetical protein